MKDYYFPHDYHASQDEKIIKLLKTMGWEGYGIYWGIVERLHKEGGWLTKDFEALSFDMRTHSERIANAVLDFNLFIFDGNKFTTQRVLDNITKQQEKSDKARQSAQLSWLHRDRKHANAMPVQSERNAIKERKGKERKVNTNIQIHISKDKYLSSVFLSKEEYSKLIDRFGQEGTEKRIYNLNNGICSKGYKYKSHYHTILSWESKNERNQLV